MKMLVLIGLTLLGGLGYRCEGAGALPSPLSAESTWAEAEAEEKSLLIAPDPADLDSLGKIDCPLNNRRDAMWTPHKKSKSEEKSVSRKSVEPVARCSQVTQEHVGYLL